MEKDIPRSSTILLHSKILFGGMILVLKYFHGRKAAFHGEKRKASMHSVLLEIVSSIRTLMFIQRRFERTATKLLHFKWEVA